MMRGCYAGGWEERGVCGMRGRGLCHTEPLGIVWGRVWLGALWGGHSSLSTVDGQSNPNPNLPSPALAMRPPKGLHTVPLLGDRQRNTAGTQHMSTCATIEGGADRMRKCAQCAGNVVIV